MDGYPMPIANMLVDVAAGTRLLVFWMAMLDTIRYSWLSRISIRLRLDALDMLDCSNRFS
jgi:hypothetical protein